MASPAVTPHPRAAFLSSIGKVLLLGLILREAFSFWTGHPYDFEIWLRTGRAVSYGANPYEMPWPSIPGVSITYQGELLPSAAYLPFWPLLTGGLYALWTVVGHGNRFVLYFLIKQPSILADVASAYLLFRLGRRWSGDSAKGLGLAKFWSFFPYAIIVSAIWGMFDSIVVLILLATLLVSEPIERDVLWGLGILVKWVTAIFLPLEIFRSRGLRRLGFLIAVAIPAGATLIVFAAEGWSLTHLTQGSIAQTHGGGYGMNFAWFFWIEPLYSQLSGIPGLYSDLSWLYVPAVFVAGWWAARWATDGERGAVRAVSLVVAVFLLLRWGLNEQYMLYLFALLAIDTSLNHPERRGFFLFLVGLSLADLLVNNDLGLRFLSPLSPKVWPYFIYLDSNGPYGITRFYALTALALAVTVTLVQLIRAIVRDDPNVFPWLVAWFPALATRLLRPRSPP